MADAVTFTHIKESDNYYTKKETWATIDEFLPKTGVVWEPFYGDGKSGQYLSELGCNVVHRKIDFFDETTRPDFDYIITNPAFSVRLRLFTELKRINKPFIIIMFPIVLSCKWFLDLWEEGDIQIIIPKKRVKFYSGDKDNYSPNGGTWFFCYKMGLRKDIVFPNQ